MDRTRLSRNPMTQKDPHCQRRPQRHLLPPDHELSCRSALLAVNGSNPTRGVMGANGSDMSVLLQAASS